MITLKEFNEDKMDSYSVEELNTLINEVEMRKSETREKMMYEMAEQFKDDRFDAFSFFGQRKLRKIAKKYDGILAGADVYIGLFRTELARREALENTSSYSGKSIAKKKEISEEEFLQKEQDKTWLYRSKIE